MEAAVATEKAGPEHDPGILNVLEEIRAICSNRSRKVSGLLTSADVGFKDARSGHT